MTSSPPLDRMVEKARITAKEVQVLLEKNSKNMTEILRLQEGKDSNEAAKAEREQRISVLVKGLNRRLQLLAAWSDISVNERRNIEAMSRGRTPPAKGRAGKSGGRGSLRPLTYAEMAQEFSDEPVAHSVAWGVKHSKGKYTATLPYQDYPFFIGRYDNMDSAVNAVKRAWSEMNSVGKVTAPAQRGVPECVMDWRASHLQSPRVAHTAMAPVAAPAAAPYQGVPPGYVPPGHAPRLASVAHLLGPGQRPPGPALAPAPQPQPQPHPGGIPRMQTLPSMAPPQQPGLSAVRGLQSQQMPYPSQQQPNLTQGEQVWGAHRGLLSQLSQPRWDMAPPPGGPAAMPMAPAPPAQAPVPRQNSQAPPAVNPNYATNHTPAHVPGSQGPLLPQGAGAPAAPPQPMESDSEGGSDGEQDNASAFGMEEDDSGDNSERGGGGAGHPGDAAWAASQQQGQGPPQRSTRTRAAAASPLDVSDGGSASEYEESSEESFSEEDD